MNRADIHKNMAAARKAGRFSLRLNEFSNETAFIFMGHLAFYFDVAQSLPTKHPSYYFHAPVAESLNKSVADITKEIRECISSGPYVLIGYCQAGFQAIEVARALSGPKGESALVILIESYAPYFKTDIEKKYPFHLKLDEAYLLVRKLFASVLIGSRRRQALVKSTQSQSLEVDENGRLANSDVQVEEKQWHKFEPYFGEVLLIRSSKRSPLAKYDPIYGWSNIFKGIFNILDVEATHSNICSGQRAVLIADLIQNATNTFCNNLTSSV